MTGLTPTTTVSGSVVHIDGACATLTVEELQAVHILQLRQPCDWHLRIVEMEDPELERPAEVCREHGDGELAPERIRHALRRRARCATRGTLEPLRHWIADRMDDLVPQPITLSRGDGRLQADSTSTHPPKHGKSRGT